jgi:putative redox protein
MKKIRLKIEVGNRVLAAQMDVHDEFLPRYFCLFAHCFTCTKDLKSINYLNETLTDKGFAVLRFDFTGLGESTGDFGSTNFENNIEDLITASEFLEQNYEAPSLLIGHSLGGAAVIQAAQMISSAKAVATIGTPFYPDHLSRIVKSSKSQIDISGRADVMISGRKFSIGSKFYNDMHESKMKLNIENLNKPLCILHSPKDKTVSIEHAEKIFATANHPKSFISLDGADHLLMNKNDAKYAATMIAEWANKYL